MTETATAATSEVAPTVTPEEAIAAFQDALEKLTAAGLYQPGVGEASAAVAPAAAAAAVTTPAEIKQPTTKRHKIAPSLVGEFETWFIQSPEDELYDVKRGQWECKVGSGKRAHALLFHSAIDDNRPSSNVICIRPVGSKNTIFNASRITYGTAMAAQKAPQNIAEAAGAIPVPFENVTSKDGGAGLDLTQLQIIAWDGSEDMIIPPVQRRRQWAGTFYVIERHFAGATVLRVEDKYFLFDTDREELQHHGFNPFFTQLPHAVASVDEAYAALMPDPVKEAIEAGKTVLRQGEFFFVKSDNDTVAVAMDVDDIVDRFFLDQVTDRLITLGAAVINCANRRRTDAIKSFIKRCEENNEGALPEGDGSAKDAQRELDQYLQWVSTSVGPECTWDVPEPTEEKNNRYGNKPTDGSTIGYSHMAHIFNELTTRLSFPLTEESRTIPGPDGYLGIHVAGHIQAQDGDTQGQQHIAAGMYARDDESIWAIGAVLHQGREHRPVYLDGWHRVYPNTATNSWSVEGDVD